MIPPPFYKLYKINKKNGTGWLPLGRRYIAALVDISRRVIGKCNILHGGNVLLMQYSTDTISANIIFYRCKIYYQQQ